MKSMGEFQKDMEIYHLEMTVKELRDEVYFLRGEVTKWQMKFCESMAKYERLITG